MVRASEYELLLREHMNFSDDDTRRTVLVSMNESQDQNKLLIALTSKLYTKITEKLDKIDYNSISRSKGDITKIEKFESTEDCVHIIQDLVKVYKEDSAVVDILATAIDNMKARTRTFQKGYTLNSPLVKNTYNNLALAIIAGTSFLINSCVEYIKSPEKLTFQMAFDTVAYNKTKENIMFESLEQFNIGCKSGEFDVAMGLCLNQTQSHREAAEIVIRHDTPFLTDGTDDPEKPTEEEEQDATVIHDVCEKAKKTVSEGYTPGMITGAAMRGLMWLAKGLIPLIRTIVYFFYHTKQNISDYWDTQADLIAMNIYELQQNDAIDDARKQQIIAKQTKLATKYKERSNRWDIDYRNAKKKAKDMASQEAKDYAVSDLNYDKNNANPAISGEGILF